MDKSNPDALDMLIAETAIPDWMKKLKRIGADDLAVGQHCLRFDGRTVRRIEAIEGEMIHFREQDGAGKFHRDYFLKLHPALAPPGFPLPPDEDFDKEFTARDEADALTVFAFRASLIKALRSGQSSTHSDRPASDRVPYSETRRLLNEVAKKLARMLELKRSHPWKYETQICRYLKMYRERWKRA